MILLFLLSLDFRTNACFGYFCLPSSTWWQGVMDELCLEPSLTKTGSHLLTAGRQHVVVQLEFLLVWEHHIFLQSWRHRPRPRMCPASTIASLSRTLIDALDPVRSSSIAICLCLHLYLMILCRIEHRHHPLNWHRSHCSESETSKSKPQAQTQWETPTFFWNTIWIMPQPN